MMDPGMTAALIAIGLHATSADLICAQRTDLLGSLAREYSEAPRALGLANNGTVMELLSARDGRTWTLLMSRPDGTSCVVAAGEAWESLPQVASGRPL